VQRMRVGRSNSVISNSRSVLTPASLTVLLKTVPTPTGPSVTLAISSTRGLNFGSFVPSARKSKTCSIGRATTAPPSKPAGIGRDPILEPDVLAGLIRLGVGPPVGDLAVDHVDDPARRQVQLDAALAAAGVPASCDQQAVAH